MLPRHRHGRAVVALSLAVALVGAGGHAAYAQDETLAQLQSQADEMVARVEEAAQTYQQATDEVNNLAAQIADNEAHTADIEARLPEQRERTAASIKSLYLFQQASPNILEIILTSTDLDEFLTTLRYLDIIHDRNAAEIVALTSLEDDLVQTQATLSLELDAATSKQDEALHALDEVRTARAELQERARAIVAAASVTDRASAIAIAEGAVSAAREAVSTLPAEVVEATTPPEESVPLEEVTQPTPAAPAVSTPTEQVATNEEVASWAARIDAYLAGSPLAGYGADFAQAALDYGVDPRISPAISCIESGKGAICFLPHNAWGWGSMSWPDWPSAIRGHVSGFASGYGSTLTLEGAKMYASNDIYETWYNLVQAEMSSI